MPQSMEIRSMPRIDKSFYIKRSSMMERAVSYERYHEAFSYDPDTGLLKWKIQSGRALPGDVAGYNSTNYVVIVLDNEAQHAQNVIWFMQTGKWPKHQVDHKDRDKHNNRWVNLRPATRSQQGANQPARGEFKGVKKNKYCSTYTAQIKVRGKCIHLGSFRTPEEAHAAYTVAARQHFGEYATPT